jgi:transcription elongation factor Elf1|tara:strand:- start:3581 stop:3865 length:285 start_codon:yes stop_codon:yes gene_type:complete|mmetsp:Transcript_734/g.2795  ORF Transcript_734/g.2795 Transcript_734/m.2795 type:complete len:95 (-) Transcript_734:54-338(-)|eukprot:CAMPEP_0119217956 /NCGR_PEP_ID=MMETSP1327-20130426/19445_1 /TAXON_ID=38833 /ORGANISM="Micromonas pusilla, Strain RCC2306" /LENGTH=94 /DNA_ID=CAMNT_0007215957 /DNA_START=198 /DNA_END=482 /DNA_ORIENTATION=+
MGKRKSSKPPPKKVAPKVDTTFTCPFCNHDKSVTAKMDHLTEKGLVECTVCGQKYTCNITHLSEPIDVYSDWIDACDKANKDDDDAPRDEEEDE